MQSHAWIALLKRMPPEQHTNLMLVTTIGMEININCLLRLEQDYAVVRGRQAGTQESGRVFFIPYDQINYFGFQKEMKEEQVLALYGEDCVPASAAPPPAPPPEPAAAEPEPPAEPASPAPIAPALTPPPAIPNRETLLDRLRARRQKANAADTPAP